MRRVKFTLSMPNVGSWNGKWSGSDKKYFRVFKMNDTEIKHLLQDTDTRYWYYDFGDGWGAGIMANIVPSGQKLPKSDGFCGYDWMIDSIIKYDDIYNSKQIKKIQNSAI